MAQSNEAYDLELFQPREPRLVALNENKRVAKDKRRRTRLQSVLNVIVYLTVALIAMAMVGYYITCNVRLTEMNKTISDCQTRLNTLQSEQVRLEAELAGKTSAEQIDQYAAENGMLPVETTQIYYIAANTEDQVSVAQSQNHWLKRLWTNLCNFLS